MKHPLVDVLIKTLLFNLTVLISNTIHHHYRWRITLKVRLGRFLMSTTGDVVTKLKLYCIPRAAGDDTFHRPPLDAL